MPSPLELNLFPSCRNCLSWSADGELAAAAEEYVHILTPRRANTEQTVNATGLSKPGTASQEETGGQWHVVRFRANVFTNLEWPTISPQNRDDFSIGVEQSTSTVAGLAWSPPGLAKCRRCTLAVLTSSLRLSFYESLGPQGKWVRVAVVNEALKRHFSGSVQDSRTVSRKSNIRSFAWCPALKVPSAERSDTGIDSLQTVPDPENRWGISLLTVTNDDDDVILLEARRRLAGTSSLGTYSIGVLTVTSLQDEQECYPMVQPYSVFASSIKPRVKIACLACGPWLPRHDLTETVYSATTTLAAIHGTRLKLVKLDVSVARIERSEYKLEASLENRRAIISGYDFGKYHFTGPLQWIYNHESDSIYLAAGIFAGLATVSMSNAVYKGSDTTFKNVEIRELPFFEDSSSEAEDKPRHWEPVSAITAASNDETHTSTLHLGTLGGHVYTGVFPSASGENHTHHPSWTKKMEDIRERFDLDHDLGGLAIARIWGLASYRNLVAAAITTHPGDMIEYRTPTNERCNIVFSSGFADQGEFDDPVFPKTVVDRSPSFLHQRREAVYRLVLNVAPESDVFSNSIWSQRLLYSAACCAIMESQNEQLLSLAQRVLERLAETTGADLTDEISKCSANSKPNTTIPPKSAAQLRGLGGRIFEKCDICETGIAWSSAQEAQCETGHLFVRCGLTFLCIQEPGISKFCSVCDMEYLNEDAVACRIDEHGHKPSCGNLFRMIQDAFDTCVYCGGKFRP